LESPFLVRNTSVFLNLRSKVTSPNDFPENDFETLSKHLDITVTRVAKGMSEGDDLREDLESARAFLAEQLGYFKQERKMMVEAEMKTGSVERRAMTAEAKIAVLEAELNETKRD